MAENGGQENEKHPVRHFRFWENAVPPTNILSAD